MNKQPILDKIEQMLGNAMEVKDQKAVAVLSNLFLIIEDTELTADGSTSDGHHTFDELYHHRMVLFSIVCKAHPEAAWKSWLHDDGTMYDDYFIVGVTTPEGDYTYHYHKEHWDKFDAKELPTAPPYDGHKPDDITRLYSLPATKAEGLDRFFSNVSSKDKYFILDYLHKMAEYAGEYEKFLEGVQVIAIQRIEPTLSAWYFSQDCTQIDEMIFELTEAIFKDMFPDKPIN